MTTVRVVPALHTGPTYYDDESKFEHATMRTVFSTIMAESNSSLACRSSHPGEDFLTKC